MSARRETPVPDDVVIVGGSIAGLTCGLMLARAGRRVTVLEWDGAAPPGDVVAAADWVRPTVPQVQHAHGFMALARSILSRRLPDVLDALLAHGATEFPLRNWIPRPRRALPRSTRPAPTS